MCERVVLGEDKDLKPNVPKSDKFQYRPLTIARTMFKGTDYRFFYAAFFLAPDQLPHGFGENEDAEIEFWKTLDWHKLPVGTGQTPGGAVKDLYRRARFVDEFKKTGGAFL